MSEIRTPDQAEIKISKRPEIQKKVEDETGILKNILPGATPQTLNTLARRSVARDERIERLRKKINIDHLTGLKNRKGFEEELKKVFSVAKRYNRSVSLLYIDLDDMKSVNDIYGHNVGDKLLREITKIMLGNFREADIISRLEGECTIARIGGDEFAVILPETTMENAMITGERLRTGTESQLALSMSKYIKNGKPLTISIGCAGYPDSNCTTPEELRHYADIALYNSKHTPEGEPVKNRITMYKEGMIMPEKKSEITETDPTEPAKI